MNITDTLPVKEINEINYQISSQHRPNPLISRHFRMMRFALRLRAFQADTETLQIMVDIPIMQMRHRLVNPPLKSRHLDFHSAPAYATDDMVMALVIRAFTVERLVIDVDDVDPPARPSVSDYGIRSRSRL